MPTGVRGTRDFYKERYALSDRLAVRLAALLARKVDLSAAAIECLKDSPPLQHVVLHPELLELAEELDTETLASLAVPGEELPASFVVAEHEGWRTIALEEELLAEQGGGEGEPTEAALPALASKGEVLHPSEIAELFTRRDIAELELILRTSADPNEKVTAIRRLALSPASEREKLALFAFALTDRDARVRSEAADALTGLGLAPEVAEDARSLAEGNERQKRFAAERIGSRIESAADAEMGVLLRIIAGTLRYEPSLEVRRLLIRAVEGACRAVAEESRSTRDLVRVLLAQLRDAIEELGPEVRRVLLILGRFNPADVYRFLQEELASIADAPMRRLLVAVAGDLASTEAERAETCAQAIAELSASQDPAVECLQLCNMLSRVGEPAVEAIAGRLVEAPEAAQDAFVRLLDVIATRPRAAKATKAKIGRLLLEALRRGQRAARLAVAHATATADPAIPASTRRGVAKELLDCLQEYTNPGIIDAIETTVVKLGAPALSPVLDALTRAERRRQRLSAARILGSLVPKLEKRHARTVGRAIRKTLGLLDTDFPERAALLRALGQMCAGPAADEATVAGVADALRARILDKTLTHAALDGLGHLCLSPCAAPTLKVDLVSFFGQLLERELPDIEAKSRTDKDEIVYELGSEVTAYTEMVPSLIAGLQNICITSPGVVRDQALDCLLRTWRSIADQKLQLGPGNTEQLLNALHAVGTLPDIEPARREVIADAAALRRDFLPTYRVLAELIVAAGDAMAPRAAALARELLRREAADKQLTESEHILILQTLVRLATAAPLGRSANRLRERIVGVVLDADKRELEEARKLLSLLHDSPSIPGRLKSRLAARIAASR